MLRQLSLLIPLLLSTGISAGVDVNGSPLNLEPNPATAGEIVMTTLSCQCLTPPQGPIDMDRVGDNELLEAGRFGPVIDAEDELDEVDLFRTFDHFISAIHRGEAVIRVAGNHKNQSPAPRATAGELGSCMIQAG